MQKAYWKEHSGDATVEAMMLDSQAKDIDKLERPEVGAGPASLQPGCSQLGSSFLPCGLGSVGMQRRARGWCGATAVGSQPGSRFCLRPRCSHSCAQGSLSVRCWVLGSGSSGIATLQLPGRCLRCRACCVAPGEALACWRAVA